MLALSILALGCIALPLIRPSSFESIYLGFVGAVFFGVLLLAGARPLAELDDRIRVDDRGIVRVGPQGPRAALRWEDVASVCERPYLQRFEVRDRSGASVIRLEYQIEDFPRLAEFVTQRIASPSTISTGSTGSFALPALFHRKVTAGAIPLALSTLLVVVSLRAFGGILIGFALFFGIAFIYWISSWLQIRVDRSAIRVRYLLFTRRIPIADVEHVSLDTESYRGGRVIVLHIHRRGRTPLRIEEVRGGLIPLYRALTLACNASERRIG